MAALPMSEGRRASPQLVTAALTIALLTAGAFLPISQHDFIDFDDRQYVFDNPMVREGLSGRTLAWAFSSVGYASNWHPLTWISHMVDVELFGDAPGPHHLVSLLLHTTNAILLLLLWRCLTGEMAGGFIVAALFAIHPLRVESVAWIAERKDILSGFFFLLTIAAYLRASRQATAPLLAVATYALGLLAKPMLVTMPVVLLLLDYWPLGRWRFAKPSAAERWRPQGQGARISSLLVEKVPFFVIALLSAVMTLYAQHKGGGLVSASESPLVPRLLNAAVSLVTYLSKAIWPSQLAFFYPSPQTALPAHRVAFAIGLLLLITVVAALNARNRPHLLTGWAWFLIMLIPVSGIVQVGEQAMADRYTYLPLIGLSFAAVTEIAFLVRKRPTCRRVLIAGVAVLLTALAMATSWQVGYWKDSEILYQRALEVTDRNWLAETALGAIASREGRSSAATARFARALSWRPSYYLAHFNLGVELAKITDYRNAEAHFREATRLRPQFSPAFLYLGRTLLLQGRALEAGEAYRRAVALDQSNPDAVGGLGTALLMTGNPREALPLLEGALRARPDDAALRHNYDLAARALNVPAQDGQAAATMKSSTGSRP